MKFSQTNYWGKGLILPIVCLWNMILVGILPLPTQVGKKKKRISGRVRFFFEQESYAFFTIQFEPDSIETIQVSVSHVGQCR